MKLMLISLARAYERHEFMINQFSRLGWEYERIHAIDALDYESLKEEFLLDSEAFESRYGFPPPLGQWGCYHSHLMAYEQIAGRRDGYYVIIEDDVRLLGAPEDLGVIMDGHPPFDICYLHQPFINGTEVGPQVTSHLRALIKAPAGTQMYIISKRMACEILDNYNVCKKPIDMLLCDLLEDGMHTFLISENPLGKHEPPGNVSYIAHPPHISQLTQNG